MRNAWSTTLVMGLALAMGGCADREGRVGGADKTTVRGPDGQKLTLVKPHNVKIRRGDAETIHVDLRRDNLDGEVSISVSRLPAGIEAVDQPRVTNDNRVEIVLRADPNADLVENHQALVTAEGPDGIRATETLEITVRSRS